MSQHTSMDQRVFVVDLASCTGCYACSIACKDRAGLPDALDFLRVEEQESGTFPSVDLHFRVIHCFHCAEPPCVEACPSDGIHKEANGLVIMDEEQCTGCSQCVEACPFDAIVQFTGGKAAKCDGCADEIAVGWSPTCVRACPMQALRYEPTSNTQFPKRTPDLDFDDHGIGPAVQYLRFLSP